MLPKQIIRIVLYGIGLSSLAAVIYMAGPLIAIGNWHPLENAIVRNIAILLLVVWLLVALLVPQLQLAGLPPTHQHA